MRPYHMDKCVNKTSCHCATQGGTGILPVIPMDRLEACPTKRPGHSDRMIAIQMAQFRPENEF